MKKCMEVYEIHSNITQNMHGASRNYRYVLDVSAYAHPLHECSKYRKGVDQIDLYLASGLGTSQDKIPKKTKCETLVD